jgi:uncharacterized protein (TIGR03000 family)
MRTQPLQSTAVLVVALFVLVLLPTQGVAQRHPMPVRPVNISHPFPPSRPALPVFYAPGRAIFTPPFISPAAWGYPAGSRHPSVNLGFHDNFHWNHRLSFMYGFRYPFSGYASSFPSSSYLSSSYPSSSYPSSPSSYYSSSSYNYSYPSGDYTSPNYNASVPSAPTYGTSSTSAYGPTTPASLPANIAVRVPEPTAEVWFEGSKTSQTGVLRTFASPPLPLGNSYTYQVRARWTENGQVIDQTRPVQVVANQQTTVDFTRPAPEPVPFPRIDY